MLLMTFFILLLLLLGGYYLSRDIFSPFVIQPGVWTVILLLYQIMPHGFFPLQNDFIQLLLTWNICFLISAYITFYYVPRSSSNAVAMEPNKRVLDVYFWLSVIVMPIVVFLTIWIAYIEDPVNMFRYLRVMNTGADENIEAPDLGILYYFVPMTYVLLFFVLLYSKKKWPIVVVLLLNLLFAFVTMAKTVFLSIIFPFLYIAYLNKKIKGKHILYGLLAFVVFSFLLQSMRSASSQDSVEMVDVNSFLSLYLLSSLSAFDTYAEPFSSHDFGGHVFRLFYAVGQNLGLDVQPENTILDFVGVPELTNTYTILYPFYVDFGWYGVILFALLYGCGYGFLYKKTVTGGKMAQVFYAIALCFIGLEFIGEFFFTNLSQELQRIFFVVLPFLFTNNERHEDRYIDGHV